MSIYAVIDTNVIVAALLTKHDNSATRKVMSALWVGDIVPLISSDIIAEYRDVLTRPKFPFEEDDVREVLESIAHCGKFIVPKPCSAALPDPKDVPFWEIILSCPNAYLVTGNKKHFPQDAHVVSPAEMLDLLER